MTSTALTAARLRRPGPRGARVLLIAGRSWLAATRSPDEHRVPVRLLDRLWLSLRRGIELDVVCGVERVLGMIGTTGGAWDVGGYDAVVLLPDLTRPALGARLRRVMDSVGQGTRLLRVTPRREPTGAWTDVRIEPEPGECPAAMVAEAVAAELGAVLDRTGAPRHVAPRADAVEDHLRRIAVLAADAFAVESSAIAVSTRGRSRTLAAVGPACPRAAVPLSPTVVLDAWRDDRAPRAAGAGDGMRFFAAQPIEGPGGAPIGVLAVADPSPRTAAEFDAGVLRDLAVLAGAEIQYAGAGR